MNVAHNARNRIYRAIKAGSLVRPGQCENCGKECKAEGAHYDYSRPFDVRWLCRRCHWHWDKQEPKNGMDGLVTFSVRPEVVDKWKRAARSEGISLPDLIRRAVPIYVGELVERGDLAPDTDD